MEDRGGTRQGGRERKARQGDASGTAVQVWDQPPWQCCPVVKNMGSEGKTGPGFRSLPGFLTLGKLLDLSESWVCLLSSIANRSWALCLPGSGLSTFHASSQSILTRLWEI